MMKIESIDAALLEPFFEACRMWHPPLLKAGDKTLFLFPGQGCQWPAMGRELLEEPVFRERIFQCGRLFEKELGWSLIEVLQANPESSRLHDSCVAQPAIFAIQVALSAQFAHWGIVPDGVIGHSVGEVAAAHVAGSLDLEAAAHVIACQNRIMQQIAGVGEMLFVAAPRDVLDPVLAAREGEVSLAAINSDKGHVLSALGGLEEVAAQLIAQGIFCKMLQIDIAFHSPLIDAHQPYLRDLLGEIEVRPPSVPVYSTLRGHLAEAGDFDGPYWCRHMREPVRFAQALGAAIEDGFRLCAEIGPHPVLSQSIDEIYRKNQCEAVRLHTLKRGQPDKVSLWFALAQMGACGKGPGPGKMSDPAAALIQRFRKEMDGLLPEVDDRLSKAAPAWRANYFRGLIEKGIAKWLGGESAGDGDMGFMAMGFTSLTALQMKDYLARELHLPLPATLLFDYPDVPALVAFLEGFFTAGHGSDASAPCVVSAGDPIAIVGMACRFPGGANTPELFWDLLAEGRDGVSEVPSDRWDVNAFFDPDPDCPGKSYSKWGGFLKGVDLQSFDAAFFKMPPREARALDPQHRLLLEVTWEALENAGYAPADLKNEPVGVFLGISTDDYKLHHLMGADLGGIDAYSALGSMYSSAGGRLSYLLGLQGPNISVDTACSSSLVALHLACQSLRSGESGASIVAGVNVMLSPNLFVYFSKLGALSPSGRCRTFDAAADGYTRGEGCGVLVLKRLPDAIEHGDRILAIVKGTAVNQDGASSSFTAPNGVAQQEVIRRALKAAGAQPDDVGYIEAHGTGTPLGDPIELGALSAVFAKGRQSPLMVGSVKTNIGHLEAGAGIAGIMKIILALQHRCIPPHLHFEQLNPHVTGRDLCITIPTKPTPWPASGHRLAGISSFGFSGTNTHVLIGEAPSLPPESPAESGISLLTISAANAESLKQLTGAWKDFNPADSSFADMCFTANTGRNHFKHRQAILAGDWPEARQKLAAVHAAWGQRERHHGKAKGKLAFLFGGQGLQYPEMGRKLYEKSPEFKRRIDECDRLLKAQFGCSILETHFQEGLTVTDFARAEATQTTIFALEYALASLWMSWGIYPGMLLGHSLGEYAAACLAGVFSLEDGLRLVYQRAVLMSRLPSGGAMAALHCDEATARKAIETHGAELEVAAVNAPQLTVVSGEKKALGTVCAALRRQDVKYDGLTVSHAFHSASIEPAIAAFRDVAESIHYAAPQIPLISNLTGQVITGAPDAGYWCRQMRGTVRFMDGIRTLEAQGCGAMIDVGPTGGLTLLARQCLPKFEGLVVPSIRKRKSWPCLLTSLASLYEHGFDVDWKAFHRGTTYRKVRLPNYAFRRKHFWTEAKQAAGLNPPSRDLIGPRIEGPAIGDTVLFQTEFTASQPSFLEEHRVFGERVSPAAAHLAMMILAVRKGLGKKQFQARDLVFPAALVLGEKNRRQVQCYFEKGHGEDLAFHLVSRDLTSGRTATWQTHFSAVLGRLDAPAAFEKTGHEHGEPIPPQAFYDALAASGQLGLGPTFRQIKSVRKAGDHEVVCGIEPLTPVANDRGIHPGLMDSLLQSLIFTTPDLQKQMLGGELFIPFQMAELRVYGDVPDGRLRCRARLVSHRSDHYAGDISVLDGDDRVILEIKEMMIRRVPANAILRDPSEVSGAWLYEADWCEYPVPVRMPEGCGAVLIFADRAGWGDRLAEALARSGRKCIRVIQGEDFVRLGPGAFAVPARQKTGYQRLLTELTGQGLNGFERVVYAWGMDAYLADSASAAQLAGLQEMFCQPLLYLIQALLETGLPGRLCCLTAGPAKTCESLASPATATLRGLCAGLAAEYPERWHRFVEIGADASIEELVRLFWEDDGPGRLYLDGSACRQPKLKRFAFQDGETLAIDPEASYLITGGTGALGLKCAQWLAKRGARHLLLVSRNPQKEAVSQFPEGVAHLVTADLADEASVKAMMEEIHQRFPPLKGVIHTAGVLADGMLVGQGWAQFEKVLAPKVSGSWNLHRHTGDVDFFVLFSSAVTLLGNRGQSNYAAANAFLDELARYRQALELPASSIAWGPWAGVGMAATDPKRQRALANLGLRAMEAAPCLDVLERTLGKASPASFGVFDMDWSQFAAQAPPRSGMWDEWLPKPAATNRTPEEKTSRKWQLDETSEVARDALLMTCLRDSAAQTLGISPSELEPDEPLMAQGFDSLMAVEMRTRLADGLGMALPVSLLFNHPSLNALFQFVKQKLAPLEALPAVEAEAIEAASDLDLLDEAELEALILKDLEDNHNTQTVGKVRI